MIRGVQPLLSGTGSRVFNEGRPNYETLRAELLAETEIQAYLAGTTLSSACLGLRPNAVHWTTVSLYYSSFFAAKAILGMLGCWVGRYDDWIQVAAGNPGGITLRAESRPYTSGGSHESLWKAYYSAISPLEQFVPDKFVKALTPVGRDPRWFLSLRHKQNYDAHAADRILNETSQKFDRSRPIESLPRDIQTSFSVASAMVGLAANLSRQFGIRPRRGPQAWDAQAKAEVADVLPDAARNVLRGEALRAFQ